MQEHPFAQSPNKGGFQRLSNSSSLTADVELIRLLREAEQHRFTADELQAALAHCGSGSPITWLLDNWPKLIDTVQNLSTKYGQERKENIIGTMSAVESRDALRMHKGNVWHAVTECIQQRQRKFNEIMSEGSYAREDVVWALTAHQGSVDLALMDLAKSKQIRPFMMKVWGPPTGVENDSGNRMELAEESIAIQQFINDNLDQSMCHHQTFSLDEVKIKIESDSSSQEADNSPSILRDIEKLIGNMELKQSQQNEDMLHNIENILGHVLSKHSTSRPMSSASNFSLNSFENAVNVKSPLPVDLKSMTESNEHADQVQQNVRAFMEQHIQDVSPDLVEYVENDLEMYDFMNREQMEVNRGSHVSENNGTGEKEIYDQKVMDEQVLKNDQNQSFAMQVIEHYHQEMEIVSPIISQVPEVHAIENHFESGPILNSTFTITSKTNDRVIPDVKILSTVSKHPESQPLSITNDVSDGNGLVVVNEEEAIISPPEPISFNKLKREENLRSPTQSNRRISSSGNTEPKLDEDFLSPDAFSQEINTNSLELPTSITLKESLENQILTNSSSNFVKISKTLKERKKERRKKNASPSKDLVIPDLETTNNTTNIVTTSNIDKLSASTNSTQTQSSRAGFSEGINQINLSSSESVFPESETVEYIHLKDQEVVTSYKVNESLASTQKHVPIRKQIIVLPQMLLSSADQHNHDAVEHYNSTEAITNEAQDSVNQNLVHLTNSDNVVRIQNVSAIDDTEISSINGNQNIDRNQLTLTSEDRVGLSNIMGPEPEILRESVPLSINIAGKPSNTQTSNNANISVASTSRSINPTNIEEGTIQPNSSKSKSSKKRRNRKRVVVNINHEQVLSVAPVAEAEQLVTSTLERAVAIVESSQVLSIEPTKTNETEDNHKQIPLEVVVHLPTEALLENERSINGDIVQNSAKKQENINEEITETLNSKQLESEGDNYISYEDATLNNKQEVTQENVTQPEQEEYSTTVEVPVDMTTEALPELIQENVQSTDQTLAVGLQTLPINENVILQHGQSSPIPLDRTHKQNLDHIIESLQLLEHERSISPTSTIDASGIDESDYSDSETEAILSSATDITLNNDSSLQRGDKNTQNLSEMVIDTRKLIQQMKDEINSDIASFVSDDSERSDDDDDDEYTDYDGSYSDDEEWDEEGVSGEEEEVDENTEKDVGDKNMDKRSAGKEDWSEGDSEYYDETEEEQEVEEEQEDGLAEMSESVLYFNIGIIENEVDLNARDENDVASTDESDGSESEYYEEEVIIDQVVLDEYPEPLDIHHHIAESVPILPPIEFLDTDSPEPFHVMIESQPDESIKDPSQITQTESVSNDNVLQLQQSQYIAPEHDEHDIQPPSAEDPVKSSDQMAEILTASNQEIALPGNASKDNDLLLETIRSIQQHDSIIQTIQKSLNTSSTPIASVTSAHSVQTNNVDIIAEVEIRVEEEVVQHKSSNMTTDEAIAQLVEEEIDSEDLNKDEIEIDDIGINQSEVKTTFEHEEEIVLGTNIISDLAAPIKNEDNSTNVLITSISLEEAVIPLEHSASQLIENTTLTSPKTASPKKTTPTPKTPTKVVSKKIPIRKASLPGIFGTLGTTNVRAMQQEFLNKQPDNGKPSKIVPPKVYKKPGSISSSLSERITKFIKPFTNGNASTTASGSSRSADNVAGGSGPVASGSSAAGSGKNKIPKKKYHETCFSDDYQTTEDEEDVPKVVVPRRRMPLRQQSMPNIMRLDLDDEETFEVFEIPNIFRENNIKKNCYISF